MQDIIGTSNKPIKYDNEYLNTHTNLKLPPHTVRIRYSNNDLVPSNPSYTYRNKSTWTKVENSRHNDWDWYCEETNWTGAFATYDDARGLGPGNYGFYSRIDPNIKIIDTGDLSDITNLSSLCAGIHSSYDIKLSTLSSANFYNSNITNCSLVEMFRDCVSLSKIYITTNTCTAFKKMFQYCKSLIIAPELDMSGIPFKPDDSQGNVFDYRLSSMFEGCENLISVPLYDTKNIRSFDCMFKDCKNLDNIPEYDLTIGKDFGYMFDGCESLSSIFITPEYIRNNMHNITSCKFMFYNCNNLVMDKIENYVYALMYTNQYKPNYPSTKYFNEYTGINNSNSNVANAFRYCYKALDYSERSTIKIDDYTNAYRE